MAERPKESAAKQNTVEVRLIARSIMQTLPDGTRVARTRGDVFEIDRKLYEADLEPDRGMGRPARGRAFALISAEKAVVEEKKAAAQRTQDRISAVRESVRESELALDQARAQARVMEAENLKTIAETVSKPLERPGARRVA